MRATRMSRPAHSSVLHTPSDDLVRDKRTAMRARATTARSLDSATGSCMEPPLRRADLTLMPAFSIGVLQRCGGVGEPCPCHDQDHNLEPSTASSLQRSACQNPYHFAPGSR